jgi:hypothetical protein
MGRVLQNIASSHSGLDVVFRNHFLSEGGNPGKRVSNETQVSETT